MSEWINVEDKLPGEQGCDSATVLCFLMGHCELFDAECRQGKAWGCQLGFYDADRRCFYVHGRPEYAVTHWQPLPPKPTIVKTAE